MKNILKFGISGNMLKTIALIAMVIDHIGFYFAPFLNESVMMGTRYIGRIAMPIFTYLMVQGFFHTTNLKKYILRIGLWASITQIILWLMMIINIKYVPEYTAASYEYTTLNILFIYVISLIMLKIIHEKFLVKKWGYNKNISLKIVLVLLIVTLSIFLPIDYNIAVPILSILLYFIEKIKITFMINTEAIRNIITKISKLNQEKIIHTIYVILIFIAILLVTYYLKLNVFILLAIFPIALYNGERGNKSKILKYSFYYVFAFHHGIFYLLSMCLALT